MSITKTYDTQRVGKHRGEGRQVRNDMHYASVKKDVATHMVDSEIVIGVRHFDFALGLVFDILDDNSVGISKGSLTKPTLEKCSGILRSANRRKQKSAAGDTELQLGRLARYLR